MTNDEREAIRREAREVALREAAEAASRVGQPVGAGDGFGTVVPGTSGDARRAILALIDTPAPQRFTVCDECGRNDLPAGDAVWADDGASYCKTCRALTQPAPPADPAGDALRELREAASSGKGETR